MNESVTRQPTLIAVLACALLSAACTGPAANTGSPAPSPTPSSASPTTTSATPMRALTPQGFLAKKIGQLAGLDCTSDLDSCAIKFSVDKIDVNPQCHQYGAPAGAGRKTLVLHVSMTTGTLSADGSATAPSIFNPFSLKGIAGDGFVHDAQSGTCTDYEGRLSNTILPNSRYSGTVEVEVPESTTSIASAHQASADGGRGWVWEIS